MCRVLDVSASGYYTWAIVLAEAKAGHTGVHQRCDKCEIRP
jgi:hypothetical protein